MTNIEDVYNREIEDFGKNVCKLRLGQGFKRQEDFAKRCKIHRTQISRIERGIFNIELETIVKLAFGLKRELVDLFDYSNKLKVIPFRGNANLAGRKRTEEKKLGTRLLWLREHRGFTQLDMEVYTGIGRSAISEFEQGTKNIEFRTLVKLAIALQVAMADLFDYNGPLPDDAN